MAENSSSSDNFDLTEEPKPSTSTSKGNSKVNSEPENPELRSQVRVVINCLIVSDSRGRGIGNYLNSQDYSEENYIPIFTDYCFPGANLRRLISETEEIKRVRHFDVTLVIGGICSLTTKNHLPPYQINYINRQEKKDNLYHLISEILQGDCHIATIPPAGLSKALTSRNPQEIFDEATLEELKSQQDDLVQDLDEINQLIIDKYTNLGEICLDWARSTFITSTKRSRSKTRKVRRFNPRHLEDGVHPIPSLRYRWFSITRKFVELQIKDLLNRRRAPTEEPEESDFDTTLESLESPFDTTFSESDTDTGNFKRQRRN